MAKRRKMWFGEKKKRRKISCTQTSSCILRVIYVLGAKTTSKWIICIFHWPPKLHHFFFSSVTFARSLPWAFLLDAFEDVESCARFTPCHLAIEASRPPVGESKWCAITINSSSILFFYFLEDNFLVYNGPFMFHSSFDEHIRMSRMSATWNTHFIYRMSVYGHNSRFSVSMRLCVCAVFDSNPFSGFSWNRWLAQSRVTYLCINHYNHVRYRRRCVVNAAFSTYYVHLVCVCVCIEGDQRWKEKEIDEDRDRARIHFIVRRLQCYTQPPSWEIDGVFGCVAFACVLENRTFGKTLLLKSSK